MMCVLLRVSKYCELIVVARLREVTRCVYGVLLVESPLS